MAKSNYKMPEDFIKKLSKLNNNYDEIVKKVLKEGSKPAVKKAKENLKLRIGQGTKGPSQSTGELLGSLETTKPEQNYQGDWTLRIGIPTDKDVKGVSNALKAAVMEYGKSGQPPKPWLKPSKRASKKDCIEAMKSALDKEVKKL